jgi:hypothetical protein
MNQVLPRFEAVKEHLAFYPHLMGACYVDGKRVKAQAGGFFGGWIAGGIVGPFKGEPGTWGWQRLVRQRSFLHSLVN